MATDPADSGLCICGNCWQCDDFPRGKGDPDFYELPGYRYVGIDKPVVEHKLDDPEDYIKQLAETADLPDTLAANDTY